MRGKHNYSRYPWSYLDRGGLSLLYQQPSHPSHKAADCWSASTRVMISSLYLRLSWVWTEASALPPVQVCLFQASTTSARLRRSFALCQGQKRRRGLNEWLIVSWKSLTRREADGGGKAPHAESNVSASSPETCWGARGCFHPTVRCDEHRLPSQSAWILESVHSTEHWGNHLDLCAKTCWQSAASLTQTWTIRGPVGTSTTDQLQEMEGEREESGQAAALRGAAAVFRLDILGQPKHSCVR